MTMAGKTQSFHETYPDIHQLKTPLLRALWALAYHKYVKKDRTYLSHTEISNLLRSKDVSCSQISIARALARAGGKIDLKSSKEAIRYRIMHEGEQHLRRQVGLEGIRVVYVDGSSAWTDRRLLLDELANRLGRDVIVVDKYIGTDTLGFVASLGKRRRVRFLTALISGSQSQFLRELHTFAREYKNFEIRKYPHEKQIHDRFLLSSDELYILGHGLKDFGKSESFVLALKGAYARDIRQLLKKNFESKWNKSTSL